MSIWASMVTEQQRQNKGCLYEHQWSQSNIGKSRDVYMSTNGHRATYAKQGMSIWAPMVTEQNRQNKGCLYKHQWSPNNICKTRDVYGNINVLIHWPVESRRDLGTVHLIFWGGGGGWDLRLGQKIFFGQYRSKFFFFSPALRAGLFFS